MDGTILSQGSFLSIYNGTNPDPGVSVTQCASQYLIQVPSAADWIVVRNDTAYGMYGTQDAYFQGGNTHVYLGVEYFWQRGMANGTAEINFYGNGSTAISGDILTSGGISIYDPTGTQAGSSPTLSTPVAITGVTNAVQPVVSTANTGALVPGSVVRLYGTAVTDINGIDFVVSAVTANTSFELLYTSNELATAPGGASGAAGFWQQVFYPPLFYPTRKIVTNITQSASSATVSTSIEHSLTQGQVIRFNIPAAAGMIQLNPTPTNNYLTATVTSIISAYSFTIDTNTASFTAFTWPTIAQMPSSFPSYEPVGMNTGYFNSNIITSGTPTYQGQQINNTNSGVFADATINTGFYGLILGGGGNMNVNNTASTPWICSGPAGFVEFNSSNQIILQSQVYWRAGKSDFGGL